MTHSKKQTPVKMEETYPSHRMQNRNLRPPYLCFDSASYFHSLVVVVDVAPACLGRRLGSKRATRFQQVEWKFCHNYYKELEKI